MTETLCPGCGTAASGSFCGQCGASLGERFCNQCGNRLEPGARFCNQCGAGVAAGAAAPAATGRAGRSGTTATAPPGAAGGEVGVHNLAWWVAGGFMVALILFVAYPMVAPEGPPAGAAAGAAPFAGGAGGAPPDISSMTPRQAADRLFDRVMRAIAAGDSAQAQQFLPMAEQAYDMARPLDSDGLFHLAMLQRTAGDLEASLATGREGLEEEPNHLLLLSVAAQAAAEAGEEAAAREYWGRLLESWDSETATDRPDYAAHDGLLPGLRTEAEAYLGR